MPIYQYVTSEPEKACGVCKKGFELRRPVDRPPLESCPLCKSAVKKLISSVSVPKLTVPLSVVDAKKAGFTILEKRDDGVYERL